MVRKINGFTLIELMIVVTVVGILAAIAYPSYQQYVRKTKRVDAQGEMTALVGSLQRYKVVNMSYLSGGTAVTLSDLGHSGYIPQQGGALYKVELKNVTAGTWDIIATPVNAQEKDGALTVDSKGKRCWYEGKDDATGACTSW